MNLNVSSQAIEAIELLSTCGAADVGLSRRILAEVRKFVSSHVAQEVKCARAFSTFELSST